MLEQGLVVGGDVSKILPDFWQEQLGLGEGEGNDLEFSLAVLSWRAFETFKKRNQVSF